MYGPLNQTTGVEAVKQFVSRFGVQSCPDGLMFMPLDDEGSLAVEIPERLRAWLVGIRLLRHLPLSYLVPDAALLPPESIRFFHVDPNWVDRVIDGVFSAVNIGTVDSLFSAAVLYNLRKALDEDLVQIAKDQLATTPDVEPQITWSPETDPITGVLIRSELVRRWPDMIVKAYSNIDPQLSTPIALLRGEPISNHIYIALFAGQPKRLTIQEPFTGIRFGVDVASNSEFQVKERQPDGAPLGGIVKGLLGGVNRDNRVLDVKALAADVGSARMVALSLEQPAYVQAFKDTATVPETRGWEPLSNS